MEEFIAYFYVGIPIIVIVVIAFLRTKKKMKRIKTIQSIPEKDRTTSESKWLKWIRFLLEIIIPAYIIIVQGFFAYFGYGSGHLPWSILAVFVGIALHFAIRSFFRNKFENS
ncbi:MAG: hypothetical protein AAB473_01775 [Patescibacteria group bacterium]